MITRVVKRMLSVILSVMMVVSMVPVQVFAVDSHDHEQAVESNDLAKDFQTQIDEILTYYLGDTELCAEEIRAAVSEMDIDTVFEAMDELDALEAELISALTEAEIAALVDANPALSEFADAVYNADGGFELMTTVEVLDGKVSVSNNGGSLSESGGTITVTAKGSLFSKNTSTVTIYNNTTQQANLSFSYTASSYNSFTIGGATANASGIYSNVLAAGASVAFVIQSKSGMSDTTATLKLSDFSLTAAAESSNVTVDFDSTLGSVTAGGEAVAAGDVLNVSLAEGVTLVATAKSGATFLGWIDANGAIRSTEASYTLTPAADMTVKAVFAKDNVTSWFAVGAASKKTQSTGLLGLSSLTYHVAGESYLFDDLNTATAFADKDASNKVVVLKNNAILPAGDYTIPAGVTLLIPFDTANSLYTTQPLNTGKDAWVQPTQFRALTMADGANLIVNGSLSLSAKHATAQGSKANGGSPTGAVSFIKMSEGSSITVNNGGVLYAWGFITGSGSVTANSGASVYENFQIMDFRGGTQSTDMDNGVFPTSQYYIQNIEVPLTIYSGATEYAYTTIYMSSADFGSSVAFIKSSKAMFNLTSGYVVKDYDESTDRLVIDSYGDLTMSPITMDFGTSDINSADYDLPINSNITVNAHSGNITITQDMAMLPGSKIIVGEDAKCALDSGISIYVYDADEWGNYTFGAGSVNSKFKAATYVPGRTYTRTEADLVDAEIVVNGTVDASLGYAYTTAGGANIHSEGSGKVITGTAGTQTVTYQLVQGTGYSNIPITPAKLKNADGTYFDTSLGGAREYQYNSENGRWICTTHTEVIDAAVAATCTEAGLTEGRHCSVCNAVIVAQTTVDALGHTEVVDAAVAPTCTETGLTEGKHCSVCGAVIEAQEVVAATGHTEVIDAAVAATCTATGLTEGKHCSVCNTVLVAQEVVAATGHTEVVDAAVAATCTATGLTEGKHCSVCNTVLVAQTVVEKLPHTADRDAATYLEHKKCTVCGEILQLATGKLGNAFDAFEEEAAVTMEDITYFARYLANWKNHTEENINVELLDLNLDGAVDSIDLIILARHDAGWVGYENLPYVPAK